MKINKNSNDLYLSAAAICFLIFVFTRLLLNCYVPEVRPIVDSLRLVNFKPSLIRFALSQDFNFTFCDHDIHFSGSSVSPVCSSDFAVNIEN